MIALSPKVAQAEIERVVAKARAHPDAMEHWFRTLPAGSVDVLAYTMFEAIVKEGVTDEPEPRAA